MRPTATFAFAGSLLAAGLLGLYFGWLLHRPGPPGPTFGLRVYFDGGYAFDRTKSDSVDVDSLRNANYPMKVKYGPQGTQLLDVKNYTLSLLPDGKTPTSAKPGLPPYDGSQTGCDPKVDLDPSKMNNSLFLPNLRDVATKMATMVKSPLDPEAVVHLTGGGTISVVALGGCVQYHDGQDNPWGDQRSMASGNGGVLYEWQGVPGTKLTLQLQPLGTGGTASSIDVTPNANGMVVLKVSSFLAYTDPPPAPYKIAHFKDHFDPAFVNIDEPKRVSLYWLGKYLVSPGIDCPFGDVPY